MGFGILFIGYFLLLNFTYYSFTDAIAGVLMLYGLYKLSSVNREFRLAAGFSLGFTLFGVLELSAELIRIFGVFDGGELLGSVTAIVRVLLTALLTVFMLRGMKDVAREVGLRELSGISDRLSALSLPIFGARLLLEVLGLFSLPEVLPLVILSVLSIIASLTLTVLILIRIYSCYMRICMPKDREIEDAPKRGGFLGALDRRREEKEKEYADYRLEKFKKKMEKRKENEL